MDATYFSYLHYPDTTFWRIFSVFPVNELPSAGYLQETNDFLGTLPYGYLALPCPCLSILAGLQTNHFAALNLKVNKATENSWPAAGVAVIAAGDVACRVLQSTVPGTTVGDGPLETGRLRCRSGRVHGL